LWLLLDPELGVLRVSGKAVDLLPVEAEAGPLLELAVAAVNLTYVRVELCVDVEVLCQVLLLREAAAANVAFESLAAQMNRQEVTFEAEARGKLLEAVGHRADELAVLALGLHDLFKVWHVV